MTQGLRIVHCFRSPVGGIFRHVRDLVDAQASAGHAVGIVCDSTTGGAYEDALFDAVEGKLALGVRRTPMQRHVGAGDIGAAWRTYRIIKELRPDILHGHGAKGGVYSRVFGSALRVFRSRVARLYSPHGGSLHYDEATPAGRMFFTAERMMGRFTDHLLFVSRHELDTYRRKVGEPRSPWSVVHNGLADAEFEPVADAAGAADLVYVGMMRDLKGPDMLIEALHAAERALGREISLVMVGDGDDRRRYAVRVEELGLAGRVRFLPAMPAREAFALGRLVVVPSRAEAMPYIVLEALAAGKPMIASAVGGIPEIFEGHAAALVRPEIADLTARIVQALGGIVDYAALMPPVEALKARFSRDAMAGRIAAAYEEARRRR